MEEEFLQLRSKNWIWDASIEARHEWHFFRRTFERNDNESLNIIISADSRYKLYINGLFVCEGPCKSNRYCSYYESINVSPYLLNGKNVIAVIAVRYVGVEPGKKEFGPPVSVVTGDRGGLFVFAELKNLKGEVTEVLSGDGKWKVYNEKCIDQLPIYETGYIGSFEHVKKGHVSYFWVERDFDDSNWGGAKQSEMSYNTFGGWRYGETDGHNLMPRPIPLMQHKKQSCSFSSMELIDCQIIVMDMGELVTAYPVLRVKGKGTIKLIYSEGYEQYENGKYIKKERNNDNGVLRGAYDIFEFENDDRYSPFWWRTFRYIKMEITAIEGSVTIEDFHYIQTHYPLDIESSFECSELIYSSLWNVSLRTIMNCMHETYEDCPYYEQLQYIMDTHLQSLYVFCISTDYRLTKKAIYDLHCSRLPVGLLQSRYPSNIQQVIPVFSLYWIFMIENYLLYVGEEEWLKQFIPTIDGIVIWFGQRLKSNLVETDEYWCYTDWVKGWDDNCIPPASTYGASTIYSLIFACALESAANICIALGRKSLSNEYRALHKDIVDSVNKYCWNKEKKLYQDGPNYNGYSVHSQLWAVLAGAVKGDDARQILTRVMDTDYAKPSYSMSFFLFRALEKAESYDETVRLWKTWQGLLDYNLTTWPEDPVTQRSDCHGWGALPLYEFPAMILGVKPAEPGYKSIEIKPHICNLNYAKGKVCTKFGVVSIEWRVNNCKFMINIISPEGIEKRVTLPDNTVKVFMEGGVCFECIIQGGKTVL